MHYTALAAFVHFGGSAARLASGVLGRI